MKSRNKRERRQHFFKKLKLSFILIFIIFILVLIYKDFDKRIDDATEVLLATKSKSILQNSINTTLNNLSILENTKSSDLYTTTYANDGTLLTIDVNTLLVNDLCNKISTDLTNELEQVSEQVIAIPILSIYNISLYSGLGPFMTSSISPMGNVDVTYNSSFKEAGINQTNFDLWLEISCQLQMSSPITKNTITVNRTVPLISTIINGKVPNYLNTPLTQ